MTKKAGAKKRVKKTVTIEETSITHKKRKKRAAPPKTSHAEKVLVENFVSLQKVITSMSVKIDKLTNQISSLLDLFELAAKTLAEKDLSIKKEERNNKEILDKIDNVLEQNRTIAKGVALIHESDSEQKPIYPPQRMMPRPISPPIKNMGDYQRSISQKSPHTAEFKQLRRE